VQSGQEIIQVWPDCDRSRLAEHDLVYRPGTVALCRLSTGGLLNTTKMNIFTLPLSIAFPAPTHDGSMVLVENRFGQWLCEHVHWLVMVLMACKVTLPLST